MCCDCLVHIAWIVSQISCQMKMGDIERKRGSMRMSNTLLARLIGTASLWATSSISLDLSPFAPHSPAQLLREGPRWMRSFLSSSTEPGKPRDRVRPSHTIDVVNDSPCPTSNRICILPSISRRRAGGRTSVIGPGYQ